MFPCSLLSRVGCACVGTSVIAGDLSGVTIPHRLIVFPVDMVHPSPVCLLLVWHGSTLFRVAHSAVNVRSVLLHCFKLVGWRSCVTPTGLKYTGRISPHRSGVPCMRHTYVYIDVQVYVCFLSSALVHVGRGLFRPKRLSACVVNSQSKGLVYLEIWCIDILSSFLSFLPPFPPFIFLSPPCLFYAIQHPHVHPPPRPPPPMAHCTPAVTKICSARLEPWPCHLLSVLAQTRSTSTSWWRTSPSDRRTFRLTVTRNRRNKPA